MGAYLPKPITDKHSTDGCKGSEKFQYAVSEMQGWRETMEDAYITAVNLDADASVGIEPVQLFAVFDGHGGSEVALFCKKYLPEVLVQQEAFKAKNFKEALVQSFYKLDEMLLDEAYASEILALKNSSDGNDEADDDVQPSGDQDEELDHSANDSKTGNANEGDVTDHTNEVNQNSQKDALRGDIEKQIEAAEVTGFLSKHEAMSLIMKMVKLRKLEDVGVDEPSEIEEREEVATEAGCTAVVALVYGNTLYVANSGDSRSILCRNNTVVALSEDHKPFNDTELSRIVAAGGFVNENGRVNGNLNLSRSIGDLKYKSNASLHPSAQIITSHPDITVTNLSGDENYIVLACDGVFDVLSNEQIVEFINQRIASLGEEPLSRVVEDLFDVCICNDPAESNGIGADNMTCLIVLLKPLQSLRN